MILQIQKGEKQWKIDSRQFFDCSTTFGDPLREPSAWYVNPVEISPVRMGDWVGSVAEGGSVNFFEVKLNPHGNGTHTECYGHIDKGHQKLGECLKEHTFMAYFHRQELREKNGDQLLCLEDLPDLDWSQVEVLAIEAKGIDFPQNFSNTNPAYFEAELCTFLAKKGVKHLICNLPSVDREEDGGALAAHRAFWNYPEATRTESTITELAVFPKEMEEGFYFLDLQVAPLHNDAVPSKPLFYPLI